MVAGDGMMIRLHRHKIHHRHFSVGAGADDDGRWGRLRRPLASKKETSITTMYVGRKITRFSVPDRNRTCAARSGGVCSIH